MSLVPEQQELEAPTQPPSSTIKKKSGKQTVIQSPVRGSARPRGTTNPQVSTEVPAPMMPPPGMNLDALASLQEDEIRKLIESLQGLAASRQEETTPTQKPPVHASAPEEEEAIRWGQLVTGQVPFTEAPHTRPPPTHDPINVQTLAVGKTPSDLFPPSQVSTLYL